MSISSIVVIFVCLAFLYRDIWCWFDTAKNNGFILILITIKYKIYHLIYDINAMCDLTNKQINILNIITILYTLITYTIKIFLIFARCMFEKQSYCEKFNSMFYYAVYIGIAITSDVIAVVQIIITYYLKCSLNVMKVLLKKPKRRLDFIVKSYMAIADCYDKIRPLYDWTVKLLLVIDSL